MELYPLVDAFVLHVCVHMLACVNLNCLMSLLIYIYKKQLNIDLKPTQVFSNRQSVTLFQSFNMGRVQST